MPKPNTIPLKTKHIPDDIYKAIVKKKKDVERKDYQCGLGRAVILLLKDLLLENEKLKK